jgi:hypothetical protein
MLFTKKKTGSLQQGETKDAFQQTTLQRRSPTNNNASAGPTNNNASAGRQTKDAFQQTKKNFERDPKAPSVYCHVVICTTHQAVTRNAV